MRKRNIVWPALALAAAVPALGGAAPLKVQPPQLAAREHQLANGLKVLLHEDHSVPVVAIQLWYHVGSKNERAGRSGFAHLFEHIMFKGSENLASGEFTEYIQSIGGRYNATTDFDRTLYFEIIAVCISGSTLRDPLNIMCSKRWAKPLRPARSFFEPT